MTTTTRKPDLQAQFMEAEPENCKGWRNVSFTATGKTIYGRLLHETKQAAADVSNKVNIHIYASLKAGKRHFLNGVEVFLSDCPITTIQIPEA